MGIWTSKSDKAVADSDGRDLMTGTEEIRRASAASVMVAREVLPGSEGRVVDVCVAPWVVTSLR